LAWGSIFQDLVADGLNQVRLAETDAAVDEQRVVARAGIVGDLQGGGARQVVGLAAHEVIER
jgi:hypothetical protein